MRRHVIQPRDNWPAIVESQGMHYHSLDDIPYWDESVCYEFTLHEINELEAATYELDRLCLQAVQFVLDEGRLDEFQIPREFQEFIRTSWEKDEPTLYGRFDLVYDGRSPPKLLEYNADTPTGLIEAAVIQWFWLQDQFQGRSQFNSIHERLIEAWRKLRTQFNSGGSPLHFVAMADQLEDFMNVNYLRDTAHQAGWETRYLHLEEIGWDAARSAFTDLDENAIEHCFKLYPWEWLQRDSYGAMLLESSTQWIEPPWKAILSNKAILPILWELFPQHPNLLEASFAPLSHDNFVTKPIFSREGANIQIFSHGQLRQATDGQYNGPVIYQALCELPNFEGFHPCLGSWFVNGWACGLGIREDESLITGNESRFVPHYF